MANLPTRTTANTAAEHVGDHNNLHAFHNLIDAAGDLIVGTGVDTAGRLAKGSALQGLRVNAAGTALEYGADAASSVVFTPAAGIAATNVQAAIEEVVSDSSAAYAPKAASAVRASLTASQSIPNATTTAISFTTEQFDTDAYHDTATDPSRFTVPAGKAGKFLIVGHLHYLANATGIRGANLRLNGTTFLAEVDLPATTGAVDVTVTVTTVETLAVGDYIELTAYQTSGAALNVVAADRSITYFTMTRIGD